MVHGTNIDNTGPEINKIKIIALIMMEYNLSDM